MKCTFNSALRWAASALLAMTPIWAQAQNAIESINVTQQGASVILKINMKDAPSAPPAGFAVANPPRIALDFANTVNALGRNSQEIGQGFNTSKIRNNTKPASKVCQLNGKAQTAIQ